jgi:RimJ/RimL family protein N-acetyltransferase
MQAVLEMRTARLWLRPWQERDRAPYAALNQDPEVMRHFPALQDRAASDASIDAWQAQFAGQGWSNWAVERLDSGAFIGFVGLTRPRRALPFGPCVEIGWRLARAHWHRGFATEAARAALDVAFERIGLDEIVSFTAVPNAPSQAVMRRIGMVCDRSEDFDHPALAAGHPLQRHVLYRIDRARWAAARSG